MSVRQLLARRRALAARLGDVQEVLSGSLAEQTRRCGKAGCRCASGQGHGPYSYFTPRAGGRSRPGYVPSGLVEVVRRYPQRGEAAEVVPAEKTVSPHVPGARRAHLMLSRSQIAPATISDLA